MGNDLAAVSCLKGKGYAELWEHLFSYLHALLQGDSHKIGLGTYSGVPFRTLSQAETPP